MIDLSMAGLLGAVVGTVVAALVYGPLVTAIERAFRARGRPQTAQEHATFGREISLLRRAVLATDIVVLGGIGYWLGRTIAG
jgi:hypothetical protein